MTKLARYAVLGACCLTWHVYGLTAGEARAEASQSLRYHYVSLDEALLPGFLFFDPVALTNNGRVYGTPMHVEIPAFHLSLCTKAER